ncbi:MAG TPA: hypothetical protein DER58_03740 [Firmicutes bacterium]|nr:hypothetical protein [Bacillota bacterium]
MWLVRLVWLVRLAWRRRWRLLRMLVQLTRRQRIWTWHRQHINPLLSYAAGHEALFHGVTVNNKRSTIAADDLVVRGHIRAKTMHRNQRWPSLPASQLQNLRQIIRGIEVVAELQMQQVSSRIRPQSVQNVRMASG